MQSRQHGEHIIKRHQFRRTFDRGNSIVERHGLMGTATLAGLVSAGVVYQDMPHRGRCYAKKMSTVLPILTRIAREANVGFKHQRGGLQSLSRPLLPHLPSGNATQLVIDNGDELV